MGNALPYPQPAAHLCAADVHQWGVGQAHSLWQGVGADWPAGAWIYHNGVMGKDVVGMAPAVEAVPVVAADEQHKLPMGMGLAQVLQGDPCVGGLRQMKLCIARHQTGMRLEGSLHHAEAQAVGQQVVGLLQRIVGRHHKPHLVEPCLGKQPLGKGDVAIVDGVERTAEYSGFQGVVIGLKG